MTVPDVASCFVSFPDERCITRLLDAFRRVAEGRIPAPRVRSGYSYSTSCQIHCCLVSHSAPDVDEVRVAQGATCRGVDEHDVQRLQAVSDARQFRFDICGCDDIAIW